MSNTSLKIIKILEHSEKPISVLEFVKKLKINKTTAYRNLDKLITEHKVLEVDLGDGKKHYELSDLNHHHHLICVKCQKVQDVEVDEKFDTPKDFKIIKHNLEFFGFCASCS